MLFRDVIDLCTISYTQNDMGDVIETETNKQVFANKKSIRQSEFYQAAATGLKPELMFEIRYSDYDDEKSIIYDTKKYTIIRTYTKNDEMIELICTGLVNGVQ